MNFRRTRPASGTDPRGKDAPPAASRRWLARSVLLAAIVLAGHALWMPAKAALAQQLLASSWESSKHDGSPHRPWPWADTHPVARIEQARLGISQVVLAGDSGRPLAFGPGWAESSAPPGNTRGTTIISGHRDTHFAWLQDLRAGDTLRLEHQDGVRDYRVADTEVVDSRRHRIATGPDADTLVLVTCWPFDATAPRGPWRYLVHLQPVDDDAAGRITTQDRLASR